MRFRNFVVVLGSILLFAWASGSAWAATNTTTTIQFSPSGTVTVGTIASALGTTVKDNPGSPAVTNGSLTLMEAVDISGNYTSCSLQDHFTAVGGPTGVDGNGQATFTLDTTVAGTFGYVMHYTAGPGNNNSDSSPCADFTVNPACTGVTISTDLASGNGTPLAGGTYTWDVRIRLDACANATNLKAQGGTNGWATNSITGSNNPSTGDYVIQSHKRNQVITWTIDSLGSGQNATLDVTIEGTIKPGTKSGTVLGLTGPWSVVYSTDGGTTYQKSTYTGSVTVTVE